MHFLLALAVRDNWNGPGLEINVSPAVLQANLIYLDGQK